MSDRPPHWTTKFVIGVVDAHELSNAEIGRRSGITPNTMYNWSRGIAPNIESLERVLEVLGYRLEITRIPAGQPSNKEIKDGKK